MKKTLLTVSILLLAASAAPAQSWANNMFEKKENPTGVIHDFGNVPSGAQLHHSFTITNIYKVPLEIMDITPGCGCTTAVASKRVLQKLETATIDVTMDGRRFVGEKKTVSIKVKIGNPPEFLDTAILTVTANSRADLVFNPGEINFGTVMRGEGAEQTIEVDYAGSLDWKVSEVVAKDLPLDVTFEKKATEVGKAGYKIVAKLKKDAPLGAMKQEIYLKTNDPLSPMVPIVVQANVQSQVEVSPNPLNLTTLKVNETGTGRLVVRSSVKAFKILGVDGLGNGVELDKALAAEEAKAQVLVLKVTPDKAGAFKRELKVRINLQDAPLVVTIEGVVGQ